MSVAGCGSKGKAKVEFDGPKVVTSNLLRKNLRACNSECCHCLEIGVRYGVIGMGMS